LPSISFIATYSDGGFSTNPTLAGGSPGTNILDINTTVAAVDRIVTFHLGATIAGIPVYNKAWEGLFITDFTVDGRLV